MFVVAILSHRVLLSTPVVMGSFSSPMEGVKHNHQKLYYVRTNTTEKESGAGSPRKINNKTGQTKLHFTHPVSTRSSYRWRNQGHTGRVPSWFFEWKGYGAVLILPQIIISTTHCDNVINSNAIACMVYIGSHIEGDETERGHSTSPDTARVPQPRYNTNTLSHPCGCCKTQSTHHW